MLKSLRKISNGWLTTRFFQSHSSGIDMLNDIKSEDLQTFLTPSLKSKPDTKNLPFASIMSDHMLLIEWFKGYGWSSPIIKKHEALLMHPAAGALQYGSQIYEGMKGFYGIDGKIRIFRPELNMKRFQKSARRMCLPSFDEDELLNCIVELVRLEKDWIPPEEGNSLYIRPTFISLDNISADQDINRALLFVIVSPSGPYFPGGKMKPISLLANPVHVRSWHGGIGDVKAGGNYGATLYLQKDAIKKNCDQVLWLYEDEVTEAGGMNLFIHWINEKGEEELNTAPIDGLILEGVTRRSIIEMAKELGSIVVSERRYTIQDVVKASKENRIKHFFACGTAAVICPVNRILYEHDGVKEELDIPFDMTNDSLLMRLYNQLFDIQVGRLSPHKWARIIEH